MGNLFKVIFVLVVFTFSFLLLSPPVNAQLTCDECGYCVGNNAPSDYKECAACVYDVDLEDTYTPVDAISSRPIEGKYWTVIGCIETSPAMFTQKILQFVTSISGGIIFIFLLYGSFIILTSAGDPGHLAKGKSMIRSGITALLIILFAVFILQFVGVELLRLPGFG